MRGEDSMVESHWDTQCCPVFSESESVTRRGVRGDAGHVDDGAGRWWGSAGHSDSSHLVPGLVTSSSSVTRTGDKLFESPAEICEIFTDCSRHQCCWRSCFYPGEQWWSDDTHTGQAGVSCDVSGMISPPSDIITIVHLYRHQLSLSSHNQTVNLIHWIRSFDSIIASLRMRLDQSCYIFRKSCARHVQCWTLAFKSVESSEVN